MSLSNNMEVINMIIQNSSFTAKAYVPYAKALSNLTSSAQRLATGNKFANAADGSGELGVADRMKLNIVGTNAILSTMENAIGYSATQDDILSHVADIVTRMSELSASAVDSTKTAADRAALDAEFRALDEEVQDIASNSKYNGTALFGSTTSVRIGVESTDVIAFSSIALAALTFVTLSLNATADASAAISALKTRSASLAVLRNRARSHNTRTERALAYTKTYIANLTNAESKIRDVDVALETSEFTKNQVLVSAAQSVLAQLSNLSQGAMRFFQ